jgi:hypothetical protein
VTDWQLTERVVSTFPSFVLNINVSTQGHQDMGDNNLYLVLAIGEFREGGLVLYEAGLVIELSNRDWVVFQQIRLLT